jgi:hypothetical protein
MSEKRGRGRPKNASRAGVPCTSNAPAGKSTELPHCSKATYSNFTVAKSIFSKSVFRFSI